MLVDVIMCVHAYMSVYISGCDCVCVCVHAYMSVYVSGHDCVCVCIHVCVC